MRRWISKSAMYLVLGGGGLSCGGGQQIEPTPMNAVEGGGDILIAVRPSEFKSKIVEKLIDDYRDRSRLTTIDIAQLGDIRTDKYDALVVMGARMGFLMFNAKERRFLRRLDKPERLILVMTARVTDWEWDRDDIDVITCASKPENITPIYQKVSRRLDDILAERNAH